MGVSKGVPQLSWLLPQLRFTRTEKKAIVFQSRLAVQHFRGGYLVAPNFSKSNQNSWQYNHAVYFRRKVDLGQPRRAVTAYDIFLRNTYPEFRRRYPKLTQQQIFSLIGKSWREQTTWQDRQVLLIYIT